MLICAAGFSSPYASRSGVFSSSRRSEFNGERLESRLETESWSAGNGFGAAICHLPASFLASVKTAAPVFEIVMLETSAGVSSRIFGEDSAADVKLLVDGFRWFDQYSVPPSAASTMAAASSPLPFITHSREYSRPLPSPPPYPDSRNRDAYWQDPQAGDAHPTELRPRHRDGPDVPVFRPDGNQLFIRRQPVDGIHRQVPVSVKWEKPVRGPIRTADDHKAPL